MHWAKTHQAARYTLAVSGIKSLSLAELGAAWDDLSLDAGPGYGFPALRAALAAKAGVSNDRIVLATGTSGTRSRWSGRTMNRWRCSRVAKPAQLFGGGIVFENTRDPPRVHVAFQEIPDVALSPLPACRPAR